VEKEEGESFNQKVFYFSFANRAYLAQACGHKALPFTLF
jgi:hypothetical protein